MTMRHRKHKAERNRRKQVENIFDDEGKVSFEKVFIQKNLLHGNILCRRGKRGKKRVADFDLNAFEATYILERLLALRKWEVGEYTRFSIHERGKPRKISAAPYHARVVQRVAHEKFLSNIVHKSFITYNCASQKGKGTDFARSAMYHQLQDYADRHRDGQVKGYVLICDIHNYFGSISHTRLEEKYLRYPFDEGCMWLIHTIHSSTEDETLESKIGVPLGNEVSQTDGTLALNDLDHIIKEKWHIKAYGRYMDDFLLIHRDKKYLETCLDNIKRYFNKEGFQLNETKTRIVPLVQGFDYLGFHWRLTDTGKVVVTAKKKKIKLNHDKMKKLHKKYLAGEIPFETLYTCFNAFINHITMWVGKKKRGNTWCLRQKLKNDFCLLYKEEIIKGIEEGWIKDPRKPKKETSPSIFPDTKCKLYKKFIKVFDDKNRLQANVKDSVYYENRLLESYCVGKEDAQFWLS